MEPQPPTPSARSKGRDALRVLELFAGIGGLAHAVAGRAEVVAAVDQHERAGAVYRLNLDHRLVTRNLNHAPPRWFSRFEADLWWLSPPCQPYTIRGPQRDLDDRRAQSLRTVVAAIDAVRPRYVALENVPWFEGSRAHALVRDVLDRHGYQVSETVLCPTQLGIPGARRRFYLVAGPDLAALEPARGSWRPISDFLRSPDDPELDVPDEVRRRFDGALHVVERDDPQACAACFTAAYGRSPVYAGSYLRDGTRLRRFDPLEIAALLQFPASFHFPEGMRLAHKWALVGNSLSVGAVRHVLSAVPTLRG